MALWESVTALRKVEFITLVLTMVLPVVCSTVVLTIRHRIKTLQSQSSQSQGAFYEENIDDLKNKNSRLAKALETAQTELTALQHLAAPRQITAFQEDVLLDKLRGVKAAPVIVSAYAFEEESVSYATQIAAVLRKANWDVTLNKTSMNDFKGVSLGKINLMNQPVSGLRELSQALADAHLDLHQREIRQESIAGQLQDGCLLVVVGRK